MKKALSELLQHQEKIKNKQAGDVQLQEAINNKILRLGELSERQKQLESLSVERNELLAKAELGQDVKQDLAKIDKEIDGIRKSIASVPNDEGALAGLQKLQGELEADLHALTSDGHPLILAAIMEEAEVVAKEYCNFALGMVAALSRLSALSSWSVRYGGSRFLTGRLTDLNVPGVAVGEGKQHMSGDQFTEFTMLRYQHPHVSMANIEAELKLFREQGVELMSI